MSLKPNEKHDIENALSEDKILEILKNVQSGPVTYSKVICRIHNVKLQFNFLFPNH